MSVGRNVLHATKLCLSEILVVSFERMAFLSNHCDLKIRILYISLICKIVLCYKRVILRTKYHNKNVRIQGISLDPVQDIMR
jgi:hypothetical protein